MERRHLLQGWNLAALPAATIMQHKMRRETIIKLVQPNGYFMSHETTLKNSAQTWH